MKIQINFKEQNLIFDRPDRVIACHDLKEIRAAFDEIEKMLAQGFHVAGFLSYEAGYAFEKFDRINNTFDFPLLYFGCYKEANKIPKTIKSSDQFEIRNLRRNLDETEYGRNISLIRKHIAAGNVYQITYCLKLLFDFLGDSYALYQNLLAKQPVPYPAYIKDKDFTILSLSPELFIKKQGSYIETRPMKGTWQRGKNYFHDKLEQFRFQHDKKNRAENIMIADLLRNDLGRVAQNIRAPKLYEIAGYNTLFQMTSTVIAKIDQDIPLYTLFKALFPSGSVTGAPKIRAMQVIDQIETSPRHIYTGAIGYIAPNKDMFFNIPIRTILVQDNKAEMGIGGGIVWDSTSEGEWFESQLKAKFLVELSKA